MTFKALFYAYILGGITFVPLLVVAVVLFTIYTSVPVGDSDVTKRRRGKLEAQGVEEEDATSTDAEDASLAAVETNDLPRTRKGWLTMRRTFEEVNLDGGYVTMVRSFLDSRSKDPKRSRPRDMWYAVLKGTVLFLYENEEMTECEAAVELGAHDVVIYPEGLLDGELFAKRNAICLKPKNTNSQGVMPSVTKAMKLTDDDADTRVEQKPTKPGRQEKERADKAKVSRDEVFDSWFIFVRSNIEMEDWYLSLIHASDHPSKTHLLAPLQSVFLPADMNQLISTLDEQPDVIPTRWLNALVGRIFFSYYRTHRLEAYVIGRLMKKLSKVKFPTFLTDIVVTEVSVGNRPPTFSKPMLKELTKEGDAAMEVHFQHRGEFRITIQATATIAIGTFKSYTVKLVLAAVLKELEGNLLVKVKRPPSNRIWYAFTQTPRMVLEVEPIVSDRQITWGMILSTIEARFREIIQESVVIPNMDDIAFFDSLNYEHRGGIWQDASRQEHPSQVPDLPIVDDSQSTASAPLPDTALHNIDDSPAVEVTHPGEDLAPARSESLPVPLTETDGVLADGGNNQSLHLDRKRRQSWFSSTTSEGSALRKEVENAEFNDDDQRGRSKEPETNTSAAPRSRSTPQSQEHSQTSPDDPQIGDAPLLNTRLATQESKRSSSQHSSKRDRTKSLYTDSLGGAPEPKADTRRMASDNSTSSFLATLKSKAGDKQALSNTAKETIRKWGVNWGMRKDSNNGDIDRSSIGSAISAKLKPESAANKAKASYAEIRAAVAERKGRAAGIDDDDDNEFEDEMRSATSPLPIPNNSRRTRTVSHGSEVAGGPSSYPESISSLKSATTTSSSTSKYQSTTGEAASKKVSPSLSRTNTNEDAAASIGPSKPIHVVQPTAKTMTIPGIHASHRGEIMSMGYVAPPQPPPLSEGKASLYRLFKSSPSSDVAEPVVTDFQQHQITPAQVQEPTTQDHSHMTNSGASSIPSSPNVNSGQSLLTPRIPPPLPPRSPAAMSGPPLMPFVNPASPSPSAEQNFRRIVTKDQDSTFENAVGPNVHMGDANESPSVIDETHKNTPVAIDSIMPASDHRDTEPIVPANSNPPPPLPPRRIHVS